MSSAVPEIVPFTGRHLDEILDFHGMSILEFCGKRILDLGCGFSDLGRDLFEVGVDADVIGIDASITQKHRDWASGKTNFVTADLGKILPIQTGSVDIILATYSFPMWAKCAEQIDTFYDECRRVTKVGGLLSIYPSVATTRAFTDSEGMADFFLRNTAARLGAGDIYCMPNWECLSNDPDLLQARKIASDLD